MGPGGARRIQEEAILGYSGVPWVSLDPLALLASTSDCILFQRQRKNLNSSEGDKGWRSLGAMEVSTAQLPWVPLKVMRDGSRSSSDS